MASSYSLDLRERVFGAWQRGEGSQPEIAARFGVSVSFVRDLSRRWRESGSVAPKPHGGGRAPSVAAAAAAAIKAAVAARNDATIEEHRQSLAAAGHRLAHSDPGPLVAPTPAHAQKKTLGDDERSTARVQGLCQAFQAEVAGIAPENLVFLDESGVNRTMTRLYARSLRGTRAFGSAPRNWGDNVSTLGALSLRGPWEPLCSNGATTGPVFLAFLKHFLLPHLWPGAVVVMDNLGAHKVKGVREQIEAAGARRLYLSPSSADFNPIEMAWSKLKTFLRKTAARTTDALDKAIGAGWRAVSAKDAHGYFAHCGYVQGSPK